MIKQTALLATRWVRILTFTMHKINATRLAQRGRSRMDLHARAAFLLARLAQEEQRMTALLVSAL